MFAETEDVAVVRVHPTAVVPVGLIIANFAETIEYDQWIAVVLSNRIAIVRKIEGPLS